MAHLQYNNYEIKIRAYHIHPSTNKKALTSFDAKSLIILAPPTGLEPVTQ